MTHGKNGSQEDFKAMSTSRQDDVSIPEGHSKVEGVGLDGLKIEIKVTENNSVDNDKGDD